MNKPIEKKGLHDRNQHRFLYDFAALSVSLPALKAFVAVNKYGNESIDFANPAAVKMLNKALLKHHYKIENWDIPASYLCPPIPSRAEYIHQIADLLADSNKGEVPTGQQIRILDVGLGANCIYPIIGHQEYGWAFVGSDIDSVSIRSAQKIVVENEDLKNAIECRFQPSKKHIFENIIREKEKFDCTICNPPFHASAADAAKGTQRKLTNLGKKTDPKTTLNFGGQNAELWCEGGEMAFISKMIYESVHYRSQCKWFSSLVSKSENLKGIYAALKKVNASSVKTIPIEVGNKISRLVAWRFF